MLRNPPMIRILFVDDENHVLEGLRRAMHGMRAEWHMVFATSAPDALKLLEHASFDIVVTDMRMPGMDGRKLLLEVKRLYPQCARFILSGYSEPNSIMQIAGIAHQYLSKPSELPQLQSAIARAMTLRRLLSDPQLQGRIGAIGNLPSLPSTYQKLVTYLRGPDATLAEVARIVSMDVAMTAMILKLANSAFFGAAQSFKSAARAVSFLGLDTIVGLVLANGVFSEFENARSSLDIDALWRHSLLTAGGARALALLEKWPTQSADMAFLAGMLHGIGYLVLANVRGDGTDPDTHNSTIDQAAAGAYLLGLWGFPDLLLEAVVLQDTPSKAATLEFGLPGLVHVADRLARAVSTGQPPAFEPGYLESVGMSDRPAEWQAVFEHAAAQPG